MNKNLLILSAIGFMAVAIPFTSVMAQDDYDYVTPSEELVTTTQDMATEAESDFNSDVNCAEAAMDGEVLPEDCVSQEETQDVEDDDSYSDEVAE